MEINCKIKKSRRAKNICLRVCSDATAVLTIPWWVSREAGLHFAQQTKLAVEKIRIKNEELRIKPARTRADYLKI